MTDEHNFRADYDKTLIAWHSNFEGTCLDSKTGSASASTVCGAITYRRVPAPCDREISSSGNGCLVSKACQADTRARTMRR